MSDERLVAFLNRELSNFTVMYIKLHRFHWYIQGQRFFTLHQFFEDLYAEFSAHIDVIAERILAIGGRPLATMSKFLDVQTLAEATADNEEREILKTLVADFTQMSEEIRKIGIPLAEEGQDAATADYLTGCLKRFDKHKWMLEALLDQR
ncbi:Dps family protein [Heyndrickxia acidiproducens]|uniref:Dps family protein n=1 Tax=Heyndrickxia acidiproducens TaxID=1121084 RepID=UPI0003780EA4|nr:Dps family protein [Heyndrickxia acidiproducens]